jgi:hypothetical protein
MNAVCLLCRKPDRMWCEFLDKFNNYKVFIIVDDQEIDLSDIKRDYSNLAFIQISDNDCIDKYYTKINYFVKKDITSWERSMLFFTFIEKSFDQVWFIEDDVFLYDESVLEKIDKKYQKEDLLTRFTHFPEEKQTKWGPIENLKEPIRSAMCCVVRMSKRMLLEINEFVKIEKRFCFLEILFPTLATNLNLDYKNPDEFDSVRFNPDKLIKKKMTTELLQKNLFHPVKDIYKHKIYREGILH